MRSCKNGAREFVRRYGDSHYAALARARMEELRKSQAAAQTTVPPGFDAVPRPPIAPGGSQNPMPLPGPVLPYAPRAEPAPATAADQTGETAPAAPVWARPSFLGIFNVHAGAGVDAAPQQPAQTVAPAPPPAPAPAAAPLKPQAHSGWIIQVGAYPVEQEAKQRLASVKEQGLPPPRRRRSVHRDLHQGREDLLPRPLRRSRQGSGGSRLQLSQA